MTAIEEDEEETGVPELAVKALTAASRRAAKAGHPRILVKDRLLVRIDCHGTTVLKKLPPRKKVAIRTIRIKTRSHE